LRKRSYQKGAQKRKNIVKKPKILTILGLRPAGFQTLEKRIPVFPMFGKK
jgi:hypothetical protein